ncbi:hypothetical protein V5N11_008462 [Cardamine amara subsp. amara]|uniref:Uncharacterized protein n=1 Tax=Cardamine amara subsp. amara TaxID=228776 RepID=A0ABD0ZW50_CARAN
MTDSNGVEHTRENAISKLAIAYFEDLFKSSGNTDWGEFFDDCHSPIMPVMNVVLTADVTNEEVLNAIKSIGGDRAPGPDGLSGAFYH